VGGVRGTGHTGKVLMEPEIVGDVGPNVQLISVPDGFYRETMLPKDRHSLRRLQMLVPRYPPPPRKKG